MFHFHFIDLDSPCSLIFNHHMSLKSRLSITILFWVTILVFLARLMPWDSAMYTLACWFISSHPQMLYKQLQDKVIYSRDLLGFTGRALQAVFYLKPMLNLLLIVLTMWAWTYIFGYCTHNSFPIECLTFRSSLVSIAVLESRHPRFYLKS